MKEYKAKIRIVNGQEYRGYELAIYSLDSIILTDKIYPYKTEASAKAVANKIAKKLNIKLIWE